jgi:hypothetical protein
MQARAFCGPLPTELDVLLSVIGDGDSRHSTHSDDRLAALTGSLRDWQTLIALATRHRVIPLLYQGLKKRSWPNVPAPVQQSLQRAFAANLKRNFRLAYHGAELLRALSASRTRVIPFKGVFLAQSGYGHLSSRQVNDIDLIIDPTDRMVAGMVLESLGYYGVETLDQQEVFRNFCTQTEVDLHWDVAPEFFPVAFDFQRIFERTKPATLAGITFNDLSLQDQLLLLSVQLAKDCWERKQKLIHLQKLCDLGRVIQRLGLDELERVTTRADEQGLSRVLNFSLILVFELLSLKSPASLRMRLRADHWARKLARNSASLPELAHTELPPEKNLLLDVGLRWRQLWFYMGLRESWKDRAMYIARIVKAVGTGSVRKRTRRVNERELSTIRSDQLLVAAATDATEAAIRHWELWRAEYDLDNVDEESYWILPAVHKSLSRHHYTGPEQGRLAGVYKQMLLSNSTLQPVLVELLASFHQEGCEIIVGPPGSLVLDGTLPYLPLKPVLLIITSPAISVANELLCTAGWKPSRSVPPEELRAFIDSLEYTHSTRGSVHLCWHPLGLMIPADCEALLWASSMPEQLGNIRISRLSPLDRALIVALRGSRIQKALLNRLPGIDWRELQDRAEAIGLDPAAIRIGLSRDPDEHAPPSVLLNRHRQRYRYCPAAHKPTSFARYLRLYYSWSWQSGGLLSGFARAVNRRLSG